MSGTGWDECLGKGAQRRLHRQRCVERVGEGCAKLHAANDFVKVMTDRLRGGPGREFDGDERVGTGAYRYGKEVDGEWEFVLQLQCVAGMPTTAAQ